jgi:hypothetical protein
MASLLSAHDRPGRHMRRAIIHIGPRKTGTTSIQGLLARRRDELKAQGACYPVSPGPIMHVKLHSMLAQRRRVARLGADALDPAAEAGVRDFLPSFDAEMKALPASVNRVIFSEERLSVLRTPDEISELKTFLQPYFDSFSVVLYLRSQDAYVASRYSELLRMGTLDGPDNVVATPERLWHHDYKALLDRWAAVFGEDAMQPRIYERSAGRSFDSVADFLKVCDLDLRTSKEDSPPQRNTSMSAAGQKLMLRMAELIQQQSGEAHIRYDLWKEISNAVSESVPGQGWLPTRTEAAAFMQRCAASNEAVRLRYFPDRATLFADDSARFPVEEVEPDEAAILRAACLSFLACAARLEKLGRTRPVRRGPGPRAGKEGGGRKREQARSSPQ